MLLAGAAYCDITHDLGATIQGATVSNKADSVRDPLTANALYLKSDANEANPVQLLLISCDLACINTSDVARYRQKIAHATGIALQAILIGATHTHNGPSVYPTNYHKQVDITYLTRLGVWLVKLALAAVADAKPAQLAWGQGHAKIGYNRRCCWADGSHSMHGDTKREDFIGMEGPDDDTHTMLAVRDENQKLMALVQANTSHPTNFYGQHFYSADFPGLSRTQLQQVLGDIPILFFNGALGDIASSDMTAPVPGIESADRRIARIAHALTSQSLYLLYHATWHDNPSITHAQNDVVIPVRLPDENVLEQAKALLAKVDQGQDHEADEGIKPMDIALAHGTKLLAESFGDPAEDVLSMHAIRIDDLAVVTQPCELFCQYGLDIRRRSPAKATAILGLMDGYHGYCPTPAAIMGGGYSGQPIYWTRLATTAGDAIVDNASRLLRGLWKNG